MLEMRKQILIHKDITTNDLLATLTRWCQNQSQSNTLHSREYPTLIENFTIYLSGGAHNHY
jgi:hypothetical protein